MGAAQLLIETQQQAQANACQEAARRPLRTSLAQKKYNATSA